MQASPARRLTGPNWWLDGPGAAVEVAFAAGDDAAGLYAAWRAAVAAAAAQLAWPAPHFGFTAGEACATWAFSAPVDQLSAAAELAEAACGAARVDVSALRVNADAEAQPRVRAWLAAARDLPWLLDDDGLTLGLGAHSQTWSLADLPAEPAVPAHAARIPHVLITGTNGKTTTARMVARILRHHGLFAGNTSTDGLMLDGELVTPGDWTGPGGQLILNAGCAPLVAAATRLHLPDGPYTLVWFSMHFNDFAGLPGQIHDWPLHDALVLESAGARQVIAPLAEIPTTFGGHAAHNVANALAAALAANAMAVPLAAIAAGLATFGSTIHDNPGRANVLQLNGATILVDFAHNPDGVRQVAALVDAWPSTQRTLLVGQAGDRTDALMHALVQATLAFRPDRVVLKDTDHYLRGREKSEIPLVLRHFYREEGVPDSAIFLTPDEPTGIAETLRDAQPGHLLILLIHDDFPSSIAQLRAAGAEER